jgi:RNA polymerase sigma factor (sigma-70 family)
MVWGVCRRILGNAADAEDAFQATFLVLVRKAAAMSGRAALGDWLHGVARNTACHARRLSTRRRAKEQAMARPEAQRDPARDDWLRLLDEELARLSAKYRLPIVLCDLEGKSRREAAAQLGWPEGTVAGRLARARALLAKRLARHAPSLSVGALTTTLVEQTALAATPAALANATVRLACTLVTGSAAGGALSANVATLMHGALKTMLLKKLHVVAGATVVVLIATALGYGLLASAQAPDKSVPELNPILPPVQANAAQREPVPKPEEPKTDDKKPARLAIALDKQTYAVGEPIVLSVRLSNVSSAAFKVPATSDTRGTYDRTFTFVVKSADGKALKHPGRDYFGAMSLLGGDQTLAPGKEREREFLLNFHFLPLPPGAYTVHALFQPGSSDDKRDLRAQSPEATFRIAVTPAADVQARVTRLSKELQAGGDVRRIAPLLGFTGRAEAVAPLIELFYSQPDLVQPEAVQALLYLDRDLVKQALLESIKARGPRFRMLAMFDRILRVKPEEFIPLLTPWLDDKDGEARYAAVEGLAQVNRDRTAEAFPLLEKRLKDPLAKVRHRAASAIGFYQDAAAFAALKAVVRDPDAGVSEQATIAVGWVAKAATADSALRKEAVALLREMAATTGRAAEQAKYWLGQLGEK